MPGDFHPLGVRVEDMGVGWRPVLEYCLGSGCRKMWLGSVCTREEADDRARVWGRSFGVDVGGVGGLCRVIGVSWEAGDV